MKDFVSFLDDIERFGWSIYRRCLEPLVYVEDHGDEILVTADLPNVNKDDIEITTTGNTIEIKAKLKRVCTFNRLGAIHREVNFEYFHKILTLPSVIIPEKSKARFKNGILQIKLPKRHEKKKIVVE